jgi:hypothetical protein
VNQLWKDLEYFSHSNYALRMGTAYRMIADRIPTDEVFRKNFHSPEGWYSQLIFKKKEFRVKIVGRAFDDFFRESVVLYDGRLYRCPLVSNLTSCIYDLVSHPLNVSVRSLPKDQASCLSFAVMCR